MRLEVVRASQRPICPPEGFGQFLALENGAYPRRGCGVFLRGVSAPAAFRLGHFLPCTSLQRTVLPNWARHGF